MSDCLDDEAIANLRAGALDEAERAQVTAHMDGCEACRALVAEVARARESLVAEPAAPRVRGAALGRYVVLETVGAGAMGVVYAAYDPELRRKVALKLLRNDPFARGGSSPQRGRLLREAQSLARLSHPNVITIYDVGVIDDEVFLAMELVEEGTLGNWLRAAPRTWRAVVEMLRQAGEGLAAAHDAGLVHRDFKPENVLVGADGRAKVTDFGLAREHAATAEREGVVAVPAGEAVRSAIGESKLTLTGAILGTPAYMAAELGRGGVADARSDQFAFSATLYEALYGERPFEGADVASIASRIARGAVRAAPPKTRVPTWLRKIVTRGLRAEPAERFPSMRAYLDAIARGLSSSRRAWALAFAASVIALGGGLAFGRAQAPAACTGDDAAWGDAFDDADGAAIRGAFEVTRLPSAASTFASVQRGLAAYRSAWIKMRHEACVATRVQRSQSDAMLDLRMVCLDARRKQAAALVSVFETADAKTVTNAPAAVDALPSVVSCAETQEFLAMDPPPKSPEKRAELARLEGEAMRAIAFETASRWSECQSAVDGIALAVKELAYRPLEARVTLARGVCRIHTAPGVADVHEAGRLALLAHDDATVADAWTALVRAGYPTAPSEGEMWARYAEAAIVRLGGDDVREVTRLKWLAMNLEVEGRLDEAEECGRRDYELATKVFGADDARVITTEEVLSNVLQAEDRMDETLVLQRRVIAGRARADGPDSPSLLVSTLNEGEDLDCMGRSEEALAIYRRALGKWEPGPYGSWAHAIVGTALRHQGLYADALAEDERALALSKKEDGGAVVTSRPMAGVGLDLLALGRAREALPLLTEAVANLYDEEDFAEDALFGLARALWDSGGDKSRARETAAKAREKVRERAQKFGGRFAKQMAAVDAWLAGHG